MPREPPRRFRVPHHSLLRSCGKNWHEFRLYQKLLTDPSCVFTNGLFWEFRRAELIRVKTELNLFILFFQHSLPWACDVHVCDWSYAGKTTTSMGTCSLKLLSNLIPCFVWLLCKVLFVKVIEALKRNKRKNKSLRFYLGQNTEGGNHCFMD